jgi:hypothetical protein
MQGKLTFTNTVERFDAGDCDGGVVEVLEAEHGTGSGLDIPMILFDQIVQVFRRSQFGALPCLVFVWNFTHCSMRSGIAIKRVADRCAQLRAKRFAEKALAAATSRFGLSRKSTVLPSRSTRDTGRPNGHGTFRYVSSTCHERPLLRA